MWGARFLFFFAGVGTGSFAPSVVEKDYFLWNGEPLLWNGEKIAW